MLLIIILMIIYDYTLKKFIEVNTLKKVNHYVKNINQIYMFLVNLLFLNQKINNISYLYKCSRDLN